MAAESTTTLGASRAVNAPSRRQFGGSILAAACGAAFAGAIVLPDPSEAFPAAVSPDGELIRLCAECDALQAKVDALYAASWKGMSDDQMKAREQALGAAEAVLADQQEPLLGRIVAFRATTRQGQAARARTLLGWDKDPAWTQGGCWNDLLLGAIVRDLVGDA